MQTIVTDRVAWSVSLSVTLVSPGKTVELIQVPFGSRTLVDEGNHVLDGCPDLPMGRGNVFWRKGRSIVKYRDTLGSPVQRRLN